MTTSVEKLVKEHKIKFVDLRFTDTRGKEQHITISVNVVNNHFLKEGKPFDGSSIAGWRDIDSSDMLLMPDESTAVVDPFFKEPTLILRCDVFDPQTMTEYTRDPRSVARRAEQYLKDTGIADTCLFGPEPEFFIFDNVRWRIDMRQVFYEIDSREAAWNSETDYESGNIGHRPRIKGGYFPVPPVDSSQDIRSAMCLIMEEMGLDIETHHHEVATSNQNEINTRCTGLLKKADEIQIYKYVVHNVANLYGKTATFMPKPLVGDNGSGMHCHQSLSKEGKNVFSGDLYSGLSETALYYIGGILKHGRALCAFTNPGTNSYKRLVPGFEAPSVLVYSACNRSAGVRIPFVNSDKGKRIEVRFPDPSANPYLAFSAMLMAGLDGIINKLHPGDAMDKDIYKLSNTELIKMPMLCGTLKEALDALKGDCGFLLEGNVFSQDLIDAYIELKMQEVFRLRTTTHPVEFDEYWSV